MKNKIYNLLLIFFCLSLFSCKENDDNIDVNGSAPIIKFPIEELNIDLNKVDNLPVVAIIKSEAGLSSVSMKIETEESIIDYKTVNEFFNLNSYSLSERVEYEANYKAVIIEAVDRLNQKITQKLPLSIVDVFERPSIDFDPDEIKYDEMDENPKIDRTKFTVSSDAGLKRVEMYLVSQSGQISKGSVDLSGEKEFVFDEMIDYVEDDKGFKVKAEDTYGNITISTLPVIYKTIPAPELTLVDNVIFASSKEKQGVSMIINSIRGVREIAIFRIEGGKEVEALRQTMNNETSIEISPEIDFTASTSNVKVVVSDGRENKDVTAVVKAYVDMDVATVNISSQPLANSAHDKYPDAFGLLSFRDMKTYSIDYAIANDENAVNVDFKFYCYGGSAVPRIYSMDNTGKDGEYAGSGGKKLSAITKKNLTRFALLSDFDYENATAVTISEILSSNITKSELNPIAIGDIIAFRTGGSSSAGAARIGIMKIVNITPAKALVPGNATACVMTVEIKFPQK